MYNSPLPMALVFSKMYFHRRERVERHVTGRRFKDHYKQFGVDAYRQADS
jgi:hypothetical protein